MTELRLDTLTMPSAMLGPLNPLPPVAGDGDLHTNITADGVDDEMQRGLAYGATPTVLPYLTQDGYGRELTPREHPIAVLENDALRATFLLGLGGRLWSLIDKGTGRELLHTGTTFRPANLALRNAWFAGGVEWNLGTTGHWPLTCEPLHAARVERADGTVGLRMYEYERMRGLVLRIDASLPSDAALLSVRITIENPRETEVPVYWWSNIAVPERDDVRVIAPASSAWHFDYGRRLTSVPYPEHDGLDHSYTTRAKAAADYFFDLGRPEIPWIAALGGDGSGLMHASSARLRGRKLFLWGTTRGGTHWQEWLGDGSGRYLEIQAGLARTQLEHLPMPAHARWHWTETYGLAQAEADAVHGTDWTRAVAAASTALDATSAPSVLAREDRRDDAGDRITGMLQRASGWGALEDARRRVAGEAPLASTAAPFPASDLGEAQAYWLGLLRGRSSASAVDRAGPTTPDPGLAPTSYQNDPAWLTHLDAVDDGAARLHAGVILAATGDPDAAVARWHRCLDGTDNGWAHRAIAAVAAHRGDTATATAEYARARALLPDVPQLAIEAVGHLVSCGEHVAALRTIGTLDAALRASGRIRFAEARAALATGDLDRCGSLLEDGIEIPDLKEGEDSLDRLWTDYHELRLAAETGTTVTDEIRARAASAHPVPARYDFRMHP